MIVRQYGEKVESVLTAFDAKALNEIAFRRDKSFSIPTDQFQTDYVSVEEYSLTFDAEGTVHGETEQALLEGLEAQIREIEDALQDDEVLMVESQQGVDYPKTRGKQKNIVVGGENRLYFYAQVDPPLRMARYRRG